MRGRGLAVAGVVAVVALVVPVSLAALARSGGPAPGFGSGDAERQGLSALDAYYAIDGPLTCESDLKEVPTLPLEVEPVALLICADPNSSVPWTAPSDVVQGDLSSLVTELSDLERAPEEDYACTRQGGPAYDLLLRFSRDRVATIHGDTGGCGVVTVASAEWFGATGVLDAAIELVEQQRATTEPPATVAQGDLDCNAGRESGFGPPLSLTGDVADLTRLISCWQPNADELPPFQPGAEVPHRDVRLLAADLASHAFESKHRPPLRCPGGLDRYYFQHLFGQTRWGDFVAVYGSCHQFSVPGDPLRWWTPSPASQEILDALRR